MIFGSVAQHIAQAGTKLKISRRIDFHTLCFPILLVSFFFAFPS